jgi:thiol-disulfide isomerase/thioredoxin
VFFAAGLVLAVGLGIGLFTGIGTGYRSGRPAVGSQAPSFSLPALVGSGSVGTPANGGGNGRPAILVFFASWCVPCQAEMPALAAAERQVKAQGGPGARVAVIGVDGSDPRGPARAFVTSAGIGFPVAVDASYDVTEGQYAFTGLPEAVFIDRSGKIAGIDYGPISVGTFTAWVHRLTGT